MSWFGPPLPCVTVAVTRDASVPLALGHVEETRLERSLRQAGLSTDSTLPFLPLAFISLIFCPDFSLHCALASRIII